MTKGNVEKLLAPIDSKGQRCGLDSGLEDKKYLMFFDLTRCLSPGTPITGCPTQQVCNCFSNASFLIFSSPSDTALVEV